MKRARAFTLLEMVVALAMSAVIAAAAVGAGAAINSVMVDARRRVVVWDEAKRLEEALLSRVQEAGGDPMSSFQSVFVEDNCVADATRNLPACAGADRITVLAARPNIPVCKVTASGAVLNGVETSPCCLTPAFSGAAVLVKDNGEAVTLSLHTFNASSCQVNAPPGQGNPSPKTLGDGFLAMITPETIFPRPTGVNGAYELMIWRDVGAPANGAVDDTELSLFADRVYDFQIALGYDSSPEDGDVVDNNSSTDEWLGNAEPIPSSLPSGVVPSQLRMIDIAIAVGVPSQRIDSGPVTLLNRAIAVDPTDIYMAATRGQVSFRNLNISVP